MFVTLILFSLLSLTLGHNSLDGVIWTQGAEATKSMEIEMEAATTQAPLVVFSIDDFTMGMFSKYANVYTKEKTIVDKPLVNAIRDSVSYTSLGIAPTTVLPSDALHAVGNQLPVDNPRVILFHFHTLEALDTALPTILASLGKKPFTAIVTAPLAPGAHRAKRQVFAADGSSTTTTAAPVDTTKLCGLFINQTRIVIRKKDLGSAALCLTADADSYSPTCTPETATFTLDFTNPVDCSTGVAPKDDPTGKQTISVDKIHISISFKMTTTFYWALSQVQADVYNSHDKNAAPLPVPLLPDGKTTGKVGKEHTEYLFSHLHQQIEMSTLKDYGYKCGKTDAFSADLPKKSGDELLLQFKQFAVQPFGYGNDMFKGMNGTTFDDCVPIMSTGSWMSILVGLFFVFTLLFSISMLNTLSVMDRNDDPRTTKHLQINVKGE